MKYKLGGIIFVLFLIVLAIAAYSNSKKTVPKKLKIDKAVSKIIIMDGGVGILKDNERFEVSQEEDLKKITDHIQSETLLEDYDVRARSGYTTFWVFYTDGTSDSYDLFFYTDRSPIITVNSSDAYAADSSLYKIAERIIARW
ncbi:MAG: hypothetical protein K0S33_181 [Bacteroidetes bacterium]|jgi:hypothetical protein|nr:hypothetical protein [Bacteroidota bacterium]